MPMYDYKCPTHGLLEDIIVPINDRDNVMCSICECPMVRVATAANIVGPTFSKPLVIPNLGKSFESKREAEAYLNEKKIALCDSKGSDFKDMYDRVRNKIENNVQAKGFKDVENFRAVIKSKAAARKTVAPSQNPG